MLKVKSCRQCVFCNIPERKQAIIGELGENIGECRGGLPTAFIITTQGPLGGAQPAVFGAWPTVDLDAGWCRIGEINPVFERAS